MKVLYVENENGFPTSTPCATMVDADPEIATKVISAPITDDGRSNWKWFRLANGDLVLGCFPCGNTYFMTEADPNRP
jgi:hypothetical protein